MPKITQIPIEKLRESYRKQTGHDPTWLGDAFGWSGQQSVYNICEQFAEFIDALMPDYFPFSTIQDIAIAILSAAYAVLAHYYYWDWAYRGDDLVKEFNKLVTDTQTKINNAVADMRSKIDAEIIAPIRTNVNNINTKLKDAESRLSTLNTNINSAFAEINTAKSNIATINSNISAFNNKLSSFESRLSTLNTSIDNINTKLKDAESRLSQYKALIDDLDRRVKALEGKKETALSLFKW